ncbi:MAG: alanine--tRNA ligase [Candidatus Eisenbacteria bacterium]|jgi:alanyl-tRNA synthetase|nr:alanine--tRNA ligase [Candidatus Eisenbacteria bacterium]
MTSHELRTGFLEFFRGVNHLVIPGSSLVPQDDPTLLFANAGMNQFKGVLLGEMASPAPRVATVQKCLRVSGKHNDLEEVGTDEHHHTFFEMLGNWSFADYYKAEAIEFAWNYLTKEVGLDPNRLWATVHTSDDEARDLWPKISGISPTRVLTFGDKDNFWEMGEVGPCGPCTEIHYDLGPGLGPDYPAAGPNDPRFRRWIELWNLVFIQFRREPDGSLTPLSNRCVDTGMGFERLLALLQGVDGNYRTDLFAPIMARLSAKLGGSRTFETDPVAFRAIADHVRALTFAIADGVTPSNDGRGYVLRRILRRAARYGRKLGIEDPFLHELSAAVVAAMGIDYPELSPAAPHVAAVIEAEERSFATTLDRGLSLFGRETAQVRSTGGTTIPGDVVFRLYDTFGFPPDLTHLMAREEGLSTDMEGFTRRMEVQREHSRLASGGADTGVGGAARPGGGGIFVGYETLEVETEVVSTDPEWGISQGEEGWVVLRESPFYAEGGGQVSDEGALRGEGFDAEVQQAVRTSDGLACMVKVREGILRPGMPAHATVDQGRRFRVQAHHTGTHLLHAALRAVLGMHVRQAGSLVAPERLRFDFTHFGPMKDDEIAHVENLVNGWVNDDRPVMVRTEVPLSEAREAGALAFFGEKYGDAVRVITVPGVSMELCGGTHMDRTARIGPLRILSESGIAAGTRRIEAVSGMALLDRATVLERQLTAISKILGGQGDDPVDRAERLRERMKALEAEMAAARAASAAATARRALDSAVDIGGIRLGVVELEGAGRPELRAAGDIARNSYLRTVLIAAARGDSDVHFLVAVTDDLVAEGIHAGKLVSALAQRAGGKGGGRPHLAEAGARLSPQSSAVIESLPHEGAALIGEIRRA